MAQEVFERIEKKYLLNDKQFEAFTAQLAGHMAADSYGKHTICNIYFDTPDFELTRRSLEKPVYKEKLRLRSYGVPREDDRVFVEIKKKYKGVVYKRRAEMTLKEARQFLYQGKGHKKDSQILHELDYFLKLYQPEPMVYLCYDRIAYQGVEDAALRMTFDTNIRWRTDALELSQGAWGSELLEKGQHLLEIKIPGAMPLWLSSILNQMQLYPVSFSKIGRVYTDHLKQNVLPGGIALCCQAS